MRKFASGLPVVTPFVTSSLPGYLLEYTPASLVNTAGAVSQWSDVSGGGYHQVASGAQRPVYVASALNGLAGAQGISSNPTHMQTSGNVPWASATATIYLVCKYSTSGIGLLYESTANANTNSAQWLYNSATVNDLAVGAAFCDFAGQTATYQILTATYDRQISQGTLLTLHRGRSRMGFSPPTGATSTPLPTDILSLFSRQGNVYPADATLVHMIGYNALHSESDIQRCVDALSTTYALNTTTPTRALLVEGDSISSAYASSKPWTGHVVLDGDFPERVLSSCAWAGKTLATGFANMSLQIPTVKAGLVTDAIFFIGTNDFGNSTALVPATFFAAKLVPYIQALQAAGYRKIGVCTMLPRGGSFGGGVTLSSFETQREGTGGWNPTIRAQAATYGYDVIDIGADATMGAAGTYSNVTYYTGDTVHPTDAGQTFLYANYFKPKLTAWA